MNFTEEEIEFMQRLRTKNMGYGNIARRLEAVYRKKPTVSQVKRALATPEQKQANTEIAAMSLPNSLKQVVKLRESGATYKQITEKTGFSYPKVKSICDVFVANNSDISKSNMTRYKAEKMQKARTNRWTDEETSKLFSLNQQNVSWKEISEKLGRSQKACKQKYMYEVKKGRLTSKSAPVENTEWTTFEDKALVFSMWFYSEQPYAYEHISGLVSKDNKRTVTDCLARYNLLKEQNQIESILDEEPPNFPFLNTFSNGGRIKPMPLPEEVNAKEASKDKKWVNNRCNYSPQDELEIMVDFPNLSIDEMREKYQRDYRALAGRYEDIWDSEEPSRIAIVMEASRIVAARKAEEEQKQTEPRMGWFERRRMKRVARKAAKIQKRLDKMATKYGAILTNGDE